MPAPTYTDAEQSYWSESHTLPGLRPEVERQGLIAAQVKDLATMLDAPEGGRTESKAELRAEWRQLIRLAQNPTS